jgi:hypothetical protein
VSRFVTYDVPLGSVSRAYMETMQGLPAWAEWAAAAQAEVDGAVPPRPAPRHPAGQALRTPPGIAPAVTAPAADGPSRDNAYLVRPRPAAGGEPIVRARLSRAAEVKPIGDGIHRRR